MDSDNRQGKMEGLIEPVTGALRVWQRGPSRVKTAMGGLEYFKFIKRLQFVCLAELLC